MGRFLVTAQEQEKRTPPYHTPTWAVSCVYLAGVYPGWYLGWYPDYTWPYLGIIQSPVSYVSILPYLAAYPAAYPGVSWAYLYHIFKLDVGAETRTVRTALASSIQIANKPKIALLAQSGFFFLGR